MAASGASGVFFCLGCPAQLQHVLTKVIMNSLCCVGDTMAMTFTFAIVSSTIMHSCSVDSIILNLIFRSTSSFFIANSGNCAFSSV